MISIPESVIQSSANPSLLNRIIILIKRLILILEKTSAIELYVRIKWRVVTNSRECGEYEYSNLCIFIIWQTADETVPAQIYSAIYSCKTQFCSILLSI